MKKQDIYVKILFLGFMAVVFSLVGCQAMKARLQESESHYEYGMLYLQNRKYNLAYREFQKAGELNPKDYRVYNGLGLTYYFQGKFPLAIQEYQKAIKINPRYPDAYNNLAAALAKQNQWLEVIQYTDKALAILSYTTPEFAYYNRGVAYYHLKEYEKARTALETSLELDPNYIDTYHQLGLTLLELKLYSPAIDSFQKILQLLPLTDEGTNDPLILDSHYYLAISYLHTHQKDLAVKEFHKVIEIAPESNRAQDALQQLNTLNMK